MGIPYSIIQSFTTSFATCGDVILLTRIALLSFVYQSIMTIMNWSTAFFRVSGSRVSIATNSICLDGGNNLNSCFYLPAVDLFYTIRTFKQKQAGPVACVAKSNATGGYCTSSLPWGVPPTLGNARCTAKLFVVVLAPQFEYVRPPESCDRSCQHHSLPKAACYRTYQ